MQHATHYPPQTRGDGAAESPTVLAARLAGSRAAFASLLGDGDAVGAPWAPDRGSVMLTPGGGIEWASTPLPDALAGAR